MGYNEKKIRRYSQENFKEFPCASESVIVMQWNFEYIDGPAICVGKGMILLSDIGRLGNSVLSLYQWSQSNQKYCEILEEECTDEGITQINKFQMNLSKQKYLLSTSSNLFIIKK